MKTKIHLLSFLFVSLVLTGCSKDDDEPTGGNTAVSLNSPANLFTWEALNFWYFWQSNVPNLADSKNDNRDDFYSFLNNYSDPQDLFDNALKFTEDRFTFLAPDYRTLVQSFQGISKSNGLEFGLARFANNNDVYGYVRYIVPNSNAATKDISRGELFTHVNGTQLNLDNYQSLLFGSNDTYTLGMASVNKSNLGITQVQREDMALNGKTVTLTKEENLTENPVYISKTFNIDGKKIGYLMYNGFVANYDLELNDVFAQFKAEGITDLVLDLRYNPGGSVNSSRLLSSMVYGTNTNQLYIRQRWNSKLQSQFSKEQLEDYFANEVSSGVALNTVNLSKVYVLTTRSTASASELLINGLNPYMDVVKIGGRTTGKNEFSITLVDDKNNYWIYSPGTTGSINPKVQWGLQPLVGRNENSAGFSDYTAGFEPDHALAEDISNLGVLGDPSEPYLAKALELITGIQAKTAAKELQLPVELISSSKMGQPLRDNMYLDPEKLDPLKLQQTEN